MDFNKNILNNFLINILKFIESIGNNNEKDIKVIKNIIYKLLDKVTNGYDDEYIVLDINTSLPNNEFNMPRWHTDAYPNNSKFVTVLKGPSTLFIDDCIAGLSTLVLSVFPLYWTYVSYQHLLHVAI
jgi:hypothetical protein